MRQGVVGSDCNECSIPSSVHFFSSSYVALGENLRPKLGIGFEGGYYSWSNFPQIKFFTSWIAPTGGTIIEVQSHLQLQLYFVCESKKL